MDRSFDNDCSTRRMSLFCVCWVTFLLNGQVAVEAATSDIDFATQVRPILEQHCFACHGESEREGGLRLTNRREALTDADSGKPAILPGQPDASPLIKRISSSDSETRMPPPDDEGNARLSDEEITALRDWIAAGAEWPAEQAAQHWAYVRPTRPVVPDADDTQLTNPIDRFVAFRLAEKKLALADEEQPARLIRRVHLALTGLPPSIDQVDAFVADPSSAAYEAIVDRLLASPRYGERWAQPWLDLARYADSNGFQADQLRDSWAYRDWVIEAMNDDMPFDQFATEQLAGDLLPDATDSQKIATGFHRTVPCNVEAGVHPEENRVNQIFDRVNTTGTVFLGTTIECCQCHNHKYDPFTQDEYYQLFAFFNNTPLEVKKQAGVQWNFYGPKMTLPNSDLRKAREEKVAAIEEQITALNEEKDAVLEEGGPKSQAKIKAIQKKITARQKEIEALPEPSTLVMLEMEEPRETRKLMRGNYLSPGKQLEPDVPEVLHEMDGDLPRNRLGLAQWITSPDNPLISRVTVNRWWTTLFGRGLVTSAEDFGTRGDRPTHPQLLDWLATELTDHGWSRKRIHKRMVMSKTFRQSNRMTTELREHDPNNELYGRGPRFRMPAEMIRDNGLAISGLLSDRMGGPPIMPFQPDRVWRAVGRNAPTWKAAENDNRFRRGVYVVWRRAAPYPSFVNFDAPDRAACVVNRPRTNTPLQALTLLNDQTYLEMALALARDVYAKKSDVRDRLTLVFRRCLCRVPDSEELATLEALYESEHERFASDEGAAKKLLQTLAKAAKIDIDGVEKIDLAATFVVANAVLNLDETINY